MTDLLERAKTKIRGNLQSVKGGAFTEADLAKMLAAHAQEWVDTQSVSRLDFIDFLVKKLGLRIIELKSERYKHVIRYAWADYSPYRMALTLRPRSYLSHGTAVSLHGLNDQVPKVIYANQEQSQKPSGARLSQPKLDLAFSNRQRTSAYVFRLETLRVVLLSGKYTGRLGVATLEGSRGEELPVTGIPRTLIDIVVRPAYAGGILQVLEAYRGAMGKVAVSELVRMLRKLDYAYPYHQSIGFLMERAGYPDTDCAKLRRLGTDFDFYLIHGMKDPQYDSKWRLHYPQGL